MSFFPGLHAQITPIGTGPGYMRVVRSLPTAGTKLYTESSTGCTLYNLDLSVYRTIPYPPLPPGSSYFSILYFTESTFDTDPSSIELMMLTQDPNFVSGTRVIQEDGTILFEDLLFGFNGGGGYDDVNDRPPLFMSEDGMAYMVLGNYPTGTAPFTSKLYQLPGVLPCLDCGVAMGLQVEPQLFAGEGATLDLFPNPTTGEVHVRCTLPPNYTGAFLLIHDAGGREITRVQVAPGGSTRLDLQGQADGTYRCSLLANGRVLRSVPLVLGR